MPYVKDTLIASRGYGLPAQRVVPHRSGLVASLGDDTPWWEKLLGGSATGYNQATGAGPMSPAAADTHAAIAAQGGPGIGTIAILGAVGVGAYLFMRRKKK